jgi:hypothetical protein
MGLQMTNLLPLFGHLHRRAGGLNDDFAGGGDFGFLFDFGVLLPLTKRCGAWPLPCVGVPECWWKLRIHESWNRDKILREQSSRVLSKEFQNAKGPAESVGV